jgi:hypothetical protein
MGGMSECIVYDRMITWAVNWKEEGHGHVVT